MTHSDLPGDLTGNNPLVPWLNRLKRAVARRTPLPGLGYKVRETTNGFVQEIIPGGGGTTQTTTDIAVFRIQNQSQGYLGCFKYEDGEGSALGSSLIFVARAYKLRPVGSWRIDGITWSYAYSQDYTMRVATAPLQASETQVIVPRFLGPYTAGGTNHLGDIIYAIKVPTLATVTIGTPSVSYPVEYVDLNLDGRAWAKDNG